MARRPENYYALPLGPAARYVGVRPETITKFRHNDMFQNHYQDQGFWFYPFQDLEILAEQMRESEKRDINVAGETALCASEEPQRPKQVKVLFKDGSERTIDAIGLEADRDWVWLTDENGKTSALLNSISVQAVLKANR